MAVNLASLLYFILRNIRWFGQNDWCVEVVFHMLVIYHGWLVLFVLVHSRTPSFCTKGYFSNGATSLRPNREPARCPRWSRSRVLFLRFRPWRKRECSPIYFYYGSYSRCRHYFTGNVGDGSALSKRAVPSVWAIVIVTASLDRSPTWFVLTINGTPATALLVHREQFLRITRSALHPLPTIACGGLFPWRFQHSQILCPRFLPGPCFH